MEAHNLNVMNNLTIQTLHVLLLTHSLKWSNASVELCMYMYTYLPKRVIICMAQMRRKYVGDKLEKFSCHSTKHN